MRSVSFSNAKTSSEDAMNFAPYFCSAHTSVNSFIFEGIAVAMSILFSVIYTFSALSLIIILGIIITLCIIKSLFNNAENAKRLFVL